MPRKRKLWRVSVGGYGYTVTACERRSRPHLYLTWRAAGRKVWKSLRYSDRGRAEIEAAELAATLAASAPSAGVVTVGALLAAWETERGSKRERPKEDRAFCDRWQTFLTAERDVYDLNRRLIDRYVEQRRRSSKVSMSTVGADVKWLKTVCNWAVACEILAYSPLAFTDRVYLRQFRNPNVKRPRASQDHFEKVLKKAARVNPRFPYWLRFINALGWRETAICELKRSDFDTRKRAKAPHGRVLKRAEADKMGVERWVPMSRELRTAFDDMMSEYPTVGAAWLFPAVRNRKGVRKKKVEPRPWSRWYAAKLLKGAETDAKAKEHYPPHAYRRKWATERKHLPRADVAAAGAWLSPRTLEIYESADEGTLLEVMESPKRIREA